jgi:hypothetical protein
MLLILLVTSCRESESRDSSVGIALGYGLDDRGCRVRFPTGLRFFFSSLPRPEWFWDPPSLLSDEYQGREADHSPPSSAEVKELVELYLHSPSTPSCCGAYLSTGTPLPLPVAEKVEVKKGKLSLCLIKHQAMTTCGGNVGIALHILYLLTR